MIIKPRPIITWLLDSNIPGYHDKIGFQFPRNPRNVEILNRELEYLKEVRALKPNWGLPELVMPSFKKVMDKSAPAFEKVMPDLIREFGADDECGILILNDIETIVYGFGENELCIWCFVDNNGFSMLFFAAEYKFVDGNPQVMVTDSIIYDDNLFVGPFQNRLNQIGTRLWFVAIYSAVKKYVKVETLIIPQGVFTAISGTPLEYVEKKKVINQVGQEVVVMDSKWFKKIINDNDIPVRGFFRMQNKKNSDGEWYKELIFVDPFVRHGYHRNAKIE